MKPLEDFEQSHDQIYILEGLFGLSVKRLQEGMGRSLKLLQD